MILAPLALILLTVPGAAPETTTLVAKLGADRYADREQAAEALEALGRDALEALRQARTADDAEVRGRAELLLDRIEQELLTRPTPVSIGPDGQSLVEAVDRIANDHGFPLQFHAEAGRRARPRREASSGAAPGSFWAAIDRLGLSARWQAGSPPAPFGEGRPAVLHLYTEPGDDRRVCDHGPFRVELRLVALGATTLGCKLDVLAEPLRQLKLNGPLHLTEALDDRGHSLLRPESEPEPAPRPARLAPAEPAALPEPRLALAQTLDRPDHAATRLKRLRGTVPVEVSARRLEPRTIPLDPPEKALGQIISTDEHAFTIQGVRVDPNQGTTTLELGVLPRTGEAPPFPARRRGFRGDFRPFGPDRLWAQMELVDDHGRPVRRLANYRVHYDFRGQRLTLVFDTGDGVGPPVSLRFHEDARAPAEVAFEFSDVPLP